ncbi:DUF3298 and DUF4163 domain-containing protein [Arenibacter sp. 6A1]|uniref:DUF3298 and DUF4163 domain-containing protein n=1 Tax=Arenibacter sp. 6A1 TaxID=2720391 RepID=UPI0014480D51|nr:DUF3298 and DUF4163 domain-containing protein [Arenibacter sp. 6A1]NKI26485.1 DUF3298 and DUF4163 domain-containing protein [Arenibacter sp. 6A1]
MNTKLAFLLLPLFFLSCTNQDKLVFEPLEFKEASCDNCPKVTVQIPKALENHALASIINNTLREEVISMLSYDDEFEPTTIEEAIRSFNNGYSDMKKLYAEEPVGWEAIIDGTVTYEDDTIITIKLNSYSFTGGAHGYTSTQFFNFDKKNNIEVNTLDFIDDLDQFRLYAEIKFREQEKIPSDKSINTTGFMFENNLFYLPENIGFTKEGLQLYYEQYEVASYADGPILLNLPFQEIQPYLSLKIKS